MPRPKKSPPPPKDDAEFFEPSNSEMDIEDFLEEWAPQTSVVEIYRRKEDGSQPHVKRVGMEILRADLYGYLRDKFGNGKFILQFKDANRRIVKNLTVDVEGAEVPAAPPGYAPTQNGGRTFLEEMLLTMIASNKPQPPPPPFDLAGLAALLTALKPAQTGDPAAMLQAMAQTFQQLKPADDNVSKALEIIQKAKDIGGDGGGGGSNGDGWPGLIKDGITAVAQVLKPNGQPAVQVPPRPPIPPGASPYFPPEIPAEVQPTRFPEPETVPAYESPEDIMRKWLVAQLAFLKQKALAEKDVEFWADYIFENQEEPGCNAILTAIERGATFQDLLTFDAEIAKSPVLAPWFQKLYETLHADLNENLDSARARRDAPDVGGNAKPSTEG